MPTAMKVCLNSNCNKPIDHPINGWRCLSGHFADLCHSCASVYVEGRFCDTFHSNVPGWRCCETCGKKIHCGCIVSFHMFVLLDGGGIECLLCTRKSFILQPNHVRPQPSLCLPSHPEGIKDFSALSWSSIIGSGPTPFRQAPNLFNGERQAKASSEIDVPSSNYIRLADKQSACSLKTERNENPVKQILSGSKNVLAHGLEKGNPGVVHADQNNAFLCGSHHVNSSNTELSFQNTDVASVYASVDETQNVNNNAATIRNSPTASTLFGKEGSSHNGFHTSTNLKVCGGILKRDGRGRSPLLTQFSSCITEQPQQIPEVNDLITPLFQKTLSASDTGRIGRLVLPKKCAEAYLPTISHPEGLPLEVRDVKGNKWVFQFRFWPNNNSRMYVLEGISPCIQALQLHAGDIVTFGRLEPEGKLVMGGRKASIYSSSDQGNKAIKVGGGISAKGGSRTKGEVDSKSSQPAISGSGLITVERVEPNPVNHVKRKGSSLASTKKHSRINSGDLVELKLTFSQAQRLFRPPPDAIPEIIIIEGLEFEEYEAAPVVGRPAIHSSDYLGEEILWVQCDSCFKWRKIPVSTLLPSRWTCSANSSDPMRSVCSASQELMAGNLKDLISTVNNACIRKTSPTKKDPDLVSAPEGLDTLDNSPFREEEGAKLEIRGHSQHKSGCTCIVCIQSSNVKVSENEIPNKQQLEKDVETVGEKPEHVSTVDLCSEAGTCSRKLDVKSSEGLCDIIHGKEICASPTKAGIDLNSKPNRVEESDSSSNSVRATDLLASRPMCSEALAVIDEAELAGRLSSCKSPEGSTQRIDVDCHVGVAANTVASASNSWSIL